MKTKTVGNIPWSAIIALFIFLISQIMLFGLWKSSVDSQIKELYKITQANHEAVQKVSSLEKSVVRIEHNLIRLIERNGLTYDYDFGSQK